MLEEPQPCPCVLFTLVLESALRYLDEKTRLPTPPASNMHLSKVF